MDEKVIFYVAVAVVWGLYNLYTKGKKKVAQQKQTPRPVEQTKPVDIDQMLEELLNPTKKVVEVKKAEEVKPTQAEFTGNEDAQKSADQAFDFDAGRYYEELKKIEKEEVAKNNMSLEAQMMSEIGQSDTPVATVVEERVENVNVNEWLTANGDDIRKAIIWSEILKRPAWAN